MRFSTLDQRARRLWAKSGEGGGHGVLAHLLDVAAVAETLLLFEPHATRAWAADRFGLPPAQVARWLAAVAGLHDFGKAIPGFQAKWPEGRAIDEAQGLAFPSPAQDVTDHAKATAALLAGPLRALAGADRDWVAAVVQAIAAHHGFHIGAEARAHGKPSGEPPAWREARQAILETYWAVLAPEGTPGLDELGFPAVNWLAGLTSTADWIASNPDWFPPGERHDDLHVYHRDALDLAARALERIGWRRAKPLLTRPQSTAELVARILGETHPPRYLQTVGDQLLRDVQGPALLLVEAPMGEGKTELAFLAHLRLQAANGHRGLYLALPTQATGNALFSRLLGFLERFAEERMDVQLIHGGASMNEEVLRLREVDHSSEESLAASVWFSRRKRPLLSPYGAGTVDQALFALLNVKHHFVRLWGLGNRVVVLDEVHAYDTYTSGLIEALLYWLKALGSSVVLMSATLPRARRDELLRAWGQDGSTVAEQAYPRLLIADAAGVRFSERVETRTLPALHLFALDENLDALAEQALDLLAKGGCGAVIVNTVDRAQTLYSRLRERVGEETRLLLFHARFPLEQRTERERDVLRLFGPKGARPDRALLISTQVAEQSLDFDVDFMLSDLAPVDLLLQRAGRLHRHDRRDRPRPAAHEQARLWVAGLGPAFPDLKTTAWGFVYDAYLLGRTWALLRRETVLAMPGDIDRLVQAVYGDDPLPEDLDETVRAFLDIEAYDEYRDKVKQERLASFATALDPGAEPQEAYANKPGGFKEEDLLGLRNRTRLGHSSVTVTPVREEADGWWIDDIRFDPRHELDDATAKRLYGRQLRLSRTAVVRHFEKATPPAAFAHHPLLRHVHPLPLREGVYDQGGLRLRLDEQLGVVYGEREE